MSAIPHMIANPDHKPAGPPMLLPHDLEAEMSVLGALMMGKPGAVADVRESLTRDDFYRDAHAHIFDAMLALDGDGQPVDLVTLKNAMNVRGTLEPIGGVGYLMQLADIAFTVANLPFYVGIVREKATKRRVIEAAAALYQRAIDPASDETATDLLAHAEQQIFACAGPLSASQSRWRTMSDVFEEVDAQVDAAYSAGGVLSGLATGLTRLDAITNGLAPGALVTLAGATSMGKTALMASILANVTKAGLTSAVFSCEMGDAPLVKRVWAAEAQVSFRHLQKATFNQTESGRLTAARDRLHPFMEKFHVDKAPSLSITALRARARRLHAKSPLDLIVVDYLQYLDGVDGKRYPNEREKIADIAVGLKQLARELECPVIALSQVSRDVDKREDHRPRLSDLAESSRIEKESDIVGFLYRPDYYARKEFDGDDAGHGNGSGSGGSNGLTTYLPPIGGPREKVELGIEKNRNGPTGMVFLSFAPECMRFDNMDTAPEGIF